jgi:hypothetical protein
MRYLSKISHEGCAAADTACRGVIGSSVILSDPIFQWSRNFADGG